MDRETEGGPEGGERETKGREAPKEGQEGGKSRVSYPHRRGPQISSGGDDRGRGCDDIECITREGERERAEITFSAKRPTPQLPRRQVGYRCVSMGDVKRRERGRGDGGGWKGGREGRDACVVRVRPHARLS